MHKIYQPFQKNITFFIKNRNSNRKYFIFFVVYAIILVLGVVMVSTYITTYDGKWLGALSLQLKLNDKSENSFASNAYAFA